MSPRRVEYRLAPAAKGDLENIWQYTFETWGLDQANTYIDDLSTAFKALALSPQQGVACDQIRTGYRRHSVGRHVVYFQATEYGIAVVRVLHERMLASRHL